MKHGDVMWTERRPAIIGQIDYPDGTYSPRWGKRKVKVLWCSRCRAVSHNVGGRCPKCHKPWP